MNRRGLEISMANPVNKTISYQPHYVTASRGREGERKGDTGQKASPGAAGLAGWMRSSRLACAASVRAVSISKASSALLE